MSDPFTTHGAFSWNELITTDPKPAVKFYTDLFGWTSEEMEMGQGTYTALENQVKEIGGIMAKPPQAPAEMPPVWGVYVTVTDIDATVKRVRELGGKVEFETAIPCVGRFAVIQDPTGAYLSAIQYEPKETPQA